MFPHLLTLVKSDLHTILGRLQVWNLLLHVIALPGHLRSALQFRHFLQHIDAVHVRHNLAHLNTGNSQQLLVKLGRQTYLVRDLSGKDYWNFVTFLHCDGPAALWCR